uniref:Uncharacterized protein n=1 Tax=Thermosporothrix sp. COM3 TaxID=2490863 RepID=A0A455SD77_9CHLR|nr:hypothetical protein KTC_11580 [Thermosporothrix sp. COM3]
MPIKVDHCFKILNRKYFKELEKHFGNLLPWSEQHGQDGEQTRFAIRSDSTVTWAQAARQTVFRANETMPIDDLEDTVEQAAAIACTIDQPMPALLKHLLKQPQQTQRAKQCQAVMCLFEGTLYDLPLFFHSW